MTITKYNIKYNMIVGRKSNQQIGWYNKYRKIEYTDKQDVVFRELNFKMKGRRTPDNDKI